MTSILKIFNKSFNMSWIALFLFYSLSQAAPISPVVAVTQMSNQMLASLQAHKAELKQSNTLIYSLVKRIILPKVDVDRMGAAVVGRQYWLQATPAQRSEFIREFTQLVTSTYSNALASYDDDQVQVYPLRENYTQKPTVNVQSMILRKNGQKISINYNMARANNSWKIYDFSIENISMVQSYHSQFANVLASGGMEALLARLHQHNQGNP